ncbi:MAG: hypothetical protein PVJ23_01220 [Anaerolineae bacterium]
MIYGVFSMLMTWPLVLQLGSHMPTPDSDVFNVYWGNWWVRHALGSGSNPYFTDHLIYPIGFNLVSFAFSPVLALLWIPLSWVLPALVAYNVLFLLTIVLACLAMDQLVRYLTGNGWAALVAGLTFGLAPALVAERATHLNLAALFWIPWAALLLTRLLRESRRRDAVLLGLVVSLAFYTRLQVGVLVVLFCGVYVVGLALLEARQWSKGALLKLGGAALLTVLILTPLLFLIWQSLQQPGGEELLRVGADAMQTDLLAYVLPPQQHPLFGSWTAGTYASFAVNNQYWAYFGLVPLALVLLVVIVRPRQALPWLLTALFFFVLALGPILRFNGSLYPEIKLPYGLASDFFSLIGFNWPNRFNLGLMAAASVLVGLACAYLATRFHRSWLLAVPAALILVEYVVVPQRTIFAPPDSEFYHHIAADGEEYALVDLPLTRSDGEVHRYFQTIHTKPIVGGWDHRVPRSAYEFMLANPFLAAWLVDDFANGPGDRPDQALADLAAAGVRYLVVHKSQLKSVPESMRFLMTALKPVYQDRDIVVFSLEGASPQEVNVIHWYDEDLGLIQPTVYLHLPWDGRPPLLSLYACWFTSAKPDGADTYRLTLSAPGGAVVYEDTRSLPQPAQNLACDLVSFEWEPPYAVGEYDLAITPLTSGQALETYTARLPVLVLEMRNGVRFPAMGYPVQTTFDASLEVLGANLVGGDGFVWTDLFLRSTERHQGSYFLSVQLLDPDTGRDVSHSDDIISERPWKDGDLYQERRILWLNDVPPGQYSLRVVLQGPPAPPYYVEPSPGDVAVLDVPLLVLPASERGAGPPEGDWIVAYTHMP